MPSTKAAGTGEATVFPKKVYLLVQHFNRVLEDFKTEPKVWHNVKKLSTFISAHNALGFAEIAATHAADLLRTFYIEEKGIMSIIYGGANLKETAKVTIVQNSLEFVVCEFEIKAVDMETSEFNPLSMLQVYDTDKRPGNVGSEDYDPYRSWLTANSHEGPDFAEELDPHFAQTKVPQWKRRDEEEEGAEDVDMSQVSEVEKVELPELFQDIRSHLRRLDDEQGVLGENSGDGGGGSVVSSVLTLELLEQAGDSGAAVRREFNDSGLDEERELEGGVGENKTVQGHHSLFGPNLEKSGYLITSGDDGYKIPSFLLE
ncbi:hypothetical protein GQ43DRAFT_432447 [Delitschia confertaspora ATCC 74209]|uniref:Uncharacterized protein n=1 Tax=Delitschia confertaspora ATCC 74209 TaxID=1513339 RepID=A0A9P4JJA9_9PLEO|nr:hypothetical protein GQ43DRAFT_432447 [Delitschia confertaspora ATCC 74209]